MNETIIRIPEVLLPYAHFVRISEREGVTIVEVRRHSGEEWMPTGMVDPDAHPRY